MKKTNKLLLMTVMCLCSLLVGAKVYAAGVLDIKDQSMVCDPKSVDPGGQADCYIIGNDTDGSHVAHGVVVQFYTSDKLSIKGAAVNDRLNGASAHVFRNGDPTTGGASLDAVDGVKNFSCTVAILPQTSVRDSGCAVFYTTGTDTNAAGKFSAAAMKTPNGVSSEVATEMGNDSNLVVLGKLTVALDSDNTVEDCGNICWKTWSIPNATSYAKYVECSANAGSDPECGGVATPSSEEECHELKMTPQGTPENTVTGSFVSYTILAAGILLAISAVAIAKKNNRLQKI